MSRLGLNIRIEGVGAALDSTDLSASGSDARYRWCLFAPDDPDVETLWRPYLKECPGLRTEELEEAGGFPNLSAIRFDLVDIEDFLTGLLRIESSPITFLAEAISRSDTSFDVEDGSTVAADDVIFVGREAMRVTNVSTDTLTVARAHLGTVAVKHKLGTYVHAYVNRLKGRVGEFIVTIDSEDFDAGAYKIDRVSFDSGLGRWQFQAKSYTSVTYGLVPNNTRRTGIIQRSDRRYGYLLSAESSVRTWGHWPDDEATHCFVRLGDEVAEVAAAYSETSFGWGRRALAGSSLKEEPERGDRLTQVLLAGESYRYSVDSATDRDDNDEWTKTSHVLDLLLCHLVSSPDPEDDTWITFNFDSDFGNWASLPPGFGLGVPHSRIDWASFIHARTRTSQYLLPNFVMGDERIRVDSLFDEPLRAMNLIITTGTDGKIRCVVPAISLMNEPRSRIDWNAIKRDSLEPSKEDGKTSANVIYEIGPKGVPFTVATDDEWEDNDEAETLKIPGADPSAVRWVFDRGIARQWRNRNAPWSITCRLNLEDFISLELGSELNITFPQIPDLANGTRGWTDVPALVLRRQVNLDPPSLSVSLISYGANLRAARIAPSARITAVSSNDATVAPNYFTSDDATGGLPTTDASAFEEGDVVKLLNLDGTEADAGTETVVSISGNVITLSGNFTSSLATDLILSCADFDDASFVQTGRFAFAGAIATRTVGTDEGAPYVYAER